MNISDNSSEFQACSSVDGSSACPKRPVSLTEIGPRLGFSLFEVSMDILPKNKSSKKRTNATNNGVAKQATKENT